MVTMSDHWVHPHPGDGLQVVEISARYDDACFPGTTTNAEREGLLMQVCFRNNSPECS